MNLYAKLLQAQGQRVFAVEGIDWYVYSRFLLPAYLPHAVPAITAAQAQRARAQAGAPFARWDSDFGRAAEGPWWYVLKRGPWSIEEIKDKKKRWTIRQGVKNFSVRPLTEAEVREQAPAVARAAAARYTNASGVEDRAVLERRLAGGQAVPGVLEFMGCFQGETLVSYSENYIQDGAVWLANMRHHPEYLPLYSTYGFLNGILDYYLNQKRCAYVLDGCRSIHHRTGFQDTLIRNFEFTREFARLQVAYARWFGTLVRAAYPWRGGLYRLSEKWVNPALENLGAVLRQETIRRDGGGNHHISRAAPEAPE